MKLHVEVTQEHIDRGSAGSTEYCPIALAIRELVAEGAYVDVDSQVSVRFPGEIESEYGDLSDDAVAFVEAFDSMAPVEPFSFDIEIN